MNGHMIAETWELVPAIHSGEIIMPRTLMLLLIVLVCTAGAFGQAFTGSISGLVTDPTGALLVGAKITVTDIAKNTNYTTLTNESGFS